MTPNGLRFLPIVGVLGALACASHTTDVTLPAKPMPHTFASGSMGSSAGLIGWQQFFRDEQLHSLLRDALGANPDLKIALQRLEQARAGVRAATGAQLPQVSGVVGAGVQKVGRFTPEGAGNATTEITPGRSVPTHIGNVMVGLEASWEVDAWGRLRSARSGALARFLASAEGTRLVASSLVAEVASAYFELLALDHTTDVLNQTIVRQQEALDVVKLQMQAGRANELAVQQFAAQLANSKALSVETELTRREAEARLNLLRGAYGGQIVRPKDRLLTPVASTFAAGVPSDLLENRPDIRAAEAEVEAARCDLKAARAAFYPRFTLSAGVGFEAFNPRYLLTTPESLIYSAAAGIVAPLVNRSAIEAQFDAAKASQVEAMYNYQKVVLNAHAEVVNALARLEAGARITGLRRERKAAVAQSAAIADALYRAGKANYFEVLLAQQNELSADLELIQAMKQQQLAMVYLYRALGGGWR